ncbi:glycoside hydrolase family 16 protein [Trametes coccinea BRFM310]|uniref:Glycoside hydrolase family 16 protein n=1 Tax=Trametes coccinea (strain BRFM310) TaxID=1353009 RepID=A0A1Y2IIP6_TRAC3|nr:glycoside hydrolase family 16 protein [Trametes coccinea BRFM310]
MFLGLSLSCVSNVLLARATTVGSVGSPDRSGSLGLKEHYARSVASDCVPLSITLDSSHATDFYRSFVPVSPAGSYQLASDGLQLFLDRPQGKIVTKQNVNDKVAEGATLNSTFTLLYGTVTFTFSGPATPGVVTAAILIADQHDEIDIELVGGDPKHWQTNVFAPSPRDEQPLYGVFGEIDDYPHGQKSVEATHSYTIDWNEDRIQWSADGAVVRTLRKDDTKKNGALHYPSHFARLQLGIWDASSPAGTSEWARGPINWDDAPRRMSATFDSIEVKCPY